MVVINKRIKMLVTMKIIKGYSETYKKERYERNIFVIYFHFLQHRKSERNKTFVRALNTKLVRKE
jgi:hypothetical protein